MATEEIFFLCLLIVNFGGWGHQTVVLLMLNFKKFAFSDKSLQSNRNFPIFYYTDYYYELSLIGLNFDLSLPCIIHVKIHACKDTVRVT